MITHDATSLSRAPPGRSHFPPCRVIRDSDPAWLIPHQVAKQTVVWRVAPTPRPLLLSELPPTFPHQRNIGYVGIVNAWPVAEEAKLVIPRIKEPTVPFWRTGASDLCFFYYSYNYCL